MSLRTHETTFRVRYAETDRMGVVYYANYLVWFEVGRTELMRAAGYTYERLESEGVGLPIAEGDYRLLAPARYDDEVTVLTRLVEVKSRRVSFEYEVRRDATILARGSTAHIPVDREGRVVVLPEGVRAVLARKD